MDRLLVLDQEPQEEWASYYLNYDDLLNHLKSVNKQLTKRIPTLYTIPATVLLTLKAKKLFI